MTDHFKEAQRVLAETRKIIERCEPPSFETVVRSLAKGPQGGESVGECFEKLQLMALEALMGRGEPCKPK